MLLSFNRGILQMDFQIGDVVTLKSGSLRMTVNRIDSRDDGTAPTVCCAWFTMEDGMNWRGPFYGMFNPDSLNKQA